MVKKEIVYSGDPLCAWCYGFSDIFSNIRKTYREKVRFSMVMGGLKVKSSFLIDTSIKKLMEKNLLTVSKRTGQVFNINKLHELPEGEYNSEPPCRAVVAIRFLDPGLEFSYYKALHQAFYMNMKNINDPVCLCEEAKKLGINPSNFLQAFESEKIRKETRKDFEISKQAGVLGYPALILKDKNGQKVLNQGYKPIDQLSLGIDNWLEGKNAPMIF